MPNDKKLFTLVDGNEGPRITGRKFQGHRQSLVELQTEFMVVDCFNEGFCHL